MTTPLSFTVFNPYFDRFGIMHYVLKNAKSPNQQCSILIEFWIPIYQFKIRPGNFVHLICFFLLSFKRYSSHKDSLHLQRSL